MPIDTPIEALPRLSLLALFDATLARLDPATRVADALAAMRFQAEQTVIIAVGKAARAMADGALRALDARGVPVAGGVVVVPAPHADAADSEDSRDAADSEDSRDAADGESSDTRLSVHPGSHPIPDERSVSAARAVVEAVRAASPRGRILALISGGGSALMALPAAPMHLADKIAVTRALAERGATIHELNTVRKHLSAIKGGQLARMSRAPITTLVVSDVVGDDLGTVASGPTVPDPSTFAQALDIVQRKLEWAAVPSAVRAHLERGARGQIADTPEHTRPGDSAYLVAGTDALVEAAQEAAQAAAGQVAALAAAGQVAAQAVGQTAGQVAALAAGRVAAQAAGRVAVQAAGQVTGQADHRAHDSSRILARGITGDVTDVARHLSQAARALAARAGDRSIAYLIAGGEPTIELPARHGIGGRAQQLALLIARELVDTAGVAVLIAGSDGIDGNSRAAGAIVDGSTWRAIQRRGIDPERALRECDASPALAAVNALVITGPTGINHADLMIIAAGFNPAIATPPP